MNHILYGLRTRALVLAQRALARSGPVEHRGVPLIVAPGVHHPAPFMGVGVGALQEAALDLLPANARVLELGTGAGFWALAAARRGFDVTATDLPYVPLEAVAAAAERMGVEVRLLHSDLFAELAGRRFDAIVFNPPFHDHEAGADDERAWCGGSVVRRCLAEAPTYLAEGGAMYLIVPRIDQERYAGELAAWSVSVAATRWFPLLGRTELLALRPRTSMG